MFYLSIYNPQEMEACVYKRTIDIAIDRSRNSPGMIQSSKLKQNKTTNCVLFFIYYEF